MAPPAHHAVRHGPPNRSVWQFDASLHEKMRMPMTTSSSFSWSVPDMTEVPALRQIGNRATKDSNPPWLKNRWGFRLEGSGRLSPMLHHSHQFTIADREAVRLLRDKVAGWGA